MTDNVIRLYTEGFKTGTRVRMKTPVILLILGRKYITTILQTPSDSRRDAKEKRTSFIEVEFFFFLK